MFAQGGKYIFNLCMRSCSCFVELWPLPRCPLKGMLNGDLTISHTSEKRASQRSHLNCLWWVFLQDLSTTYNLKINLAVAFSPPCQSLKIESFYPQCIYSPKNSRVECYPFKHLQSISPLLATARAKSEKQKCKFSAIGSSGCCTGYRCETR